MHACMQKPDLLNEFLAALSVHSLHTTNVRTVSVKVHSVHTSTYYKDDDDDDTDRKIETCRRLLLIPKKIGLSCFPTLTTNRARRTYLHIKGK